MALNCGLENRNPRTEAVGFFSAKTRGSLLVRPLIKG